MKSTVLVLLLGLGVDSGPTDPVPQTTLPESGSTSLSAPSRLELEAQVETDETDQAVEAVAGPTPDAPTITLERAVQLAFERNFALLDSADAVSGARWQEKTARDDFLPSLTPHYQRDEDRSVFGVDLAQRLPWLGGTLSANGWYTSEPGNDAPYTKTTNLRLVYTQPLLRGFGPTASLFDLRNARRERVSRERALALARQDVAIEVARAFYQVTASRQLLDVARQSLSRTEALLRASNARLEVGMASKLDVFRAEQQASQARYAMVSREGALASALEQLRALLALAPGDPVEPEATALPRLDAPEPERLELLLARALAQRLEIAEARDRVADARRAASYAEQNLLPQIDLDVSLTQLGYGGSFSDAWSAGDRQIHVSLGASYPLRQSSARASHALAQLQVGSRERALRQAELAVEQEVREALRQLHVIRKSVELQQTAIDVASRQRRLAVLRYERGLGTSFDVVEAEGDLVNARSILVQLLTSWAVARLELLRATAALDTETELAP